MPGFHVDPDELAAVGRVLHAAVDPAAAGVGEPVPTAAAGDARVAAALDALVTAWAGGIAALSADATRLGDAVQVAALRYEEIDATWAARLREIDGADR